MPKMVKIRATWFESAVPKWEAGVLYPLDAESQRQVDIGNGDVVDDPADETADDTATPRPKKAKG